MKKDLIISIIAFVFLKAFVWSVKFLINAPRPVSADLWLYNPSFPSGVAADGAFIAMMLSWKFPKGKVFWHALGILAAYSRMYTGDHFLIDIIAGYLLGILWFILMRHIMHFIRQ